MDHSQFDSLARVIGRRVNRRSLLGVVAGALAAAATGRGRAMANDPVRITIRNASCASRLTGNALVDACGDNGFGCTTFRIGTSTYRTNASGIFSTVRTPARLTIQQQTTVVDKSAGIWVRCRELDSGRYLFRGRADDGVVTLDTKAGDHVTCRWFNYTRREHRNLAQPGLCPAPSTTAAPTTAAPTTSTTTTSTTTSTTTTTTAAPCGGPTQPCCQGVTCNAGNICSALICLPCGNLAQPCCAGYSCASGVCTGNLCQIYTPPPIGP